MRRKAMVVLALAMLVWLAALAANAGQTDRQTGYKVLAPIRSGNLTIFPVISARVHDTSQFITLDEGLRSGAVQVTERGAAQGLHRRPAQYTAQSAEVNRLALVNDSDRPLLLLAGEIVTGGKQDRVVGADRIVPPHSGAVDLSVFCVEPGRWTGATQQLGAMAAPMAQPSVRRPAMAERDQQSVWNEVRDSQAKAVHGLSSSEAVEVQSTTSYAGVMQNGSVGKRVDEIYKPIERDFDAIMRELRDRHAVGVVVAVNGRLIWADMFASTTLLQSYWQKLARSYAAEAFTSGVMDGSVRQDQAQAFVDTLNGTREVAETEPGIFRRAEISGEGFKVFSLTSLLPKTDYEVHVAKMASDEPLRPHSEGMLRRR
jgi:hypothetical protein